MPYGPRVVDFLGPIIQQKANKTEVRVSKTIDLVSNVGIMVCL